MRPDRTVYVLGAGFSADAGVPTIQTFLQTAREHFDAPQSPLPPYLEPHYRTVLRFRQAVKQSRDSLRLNLDDIETLFSLIDMVSLAEPRSIRARRNADSIKHVIAHTVSVSRHAKGHFRARIRNENLGDTRLSTNELERYRVQDRTQPDVTLLQFGQYEFFAALVAGLFEPSSREVDDCVITFNYDTVLEEALWELGGAVDYGVSRVLNQVARSAARPRFVIPVFKLHGSSNWARSVKQEFRAVIHDRYADFGSEHAPLVVPPTWKKGDLAPMFAEIWRGAREALAKATRICIVGYSMPQTDPFFHHLMGSALAENDGLYRLDVVDLNQSSSSPGPIAERYREVFEPLEGYRRLHFHVTGFADFLSTAQELKGALGRGHPIDEVTRY